MKPPRKVPTGTLCSKPAQKGLAGPSKTAVHSSTQGAHQSDAPPLPKRGGTSPSNRFVPSTCLSPHPPGQSWEGRAASDLLRSPARSGHPEIQTS